MGRTSKWIKHLLAGKRDKEKSTLNQQQVSSGIDNSTTPVSTRPTTPKEKRRWSFRRPSTTQTGLKEASNAEQPVVRVAVEAQSEQQKKHATAVAVAMATAAATDAAVASAQAAAAVIRLASAAPARASAAEEAAATKIQSVFRSYLARKALCALKGLVKLQALVRGHLVRKQATSTLRYMHAMMIVQARARAQRIGMVVENNSSCNHRHSTYRKSSHYDLMEENVKIVEMDIGETRGTTNGRSSYSNHTSSGKTEQTEHRYSTHGHFSKQDYQHISPAPSAITNMSPRTCSGHFEDYSFGTTQSSFEDYYSAISQPDSSKVAISYSRNYAESMSYEYSFFPNYMANTESSKAKKVRSHSAPKQRPVDTFERQSSKRRPSIEGRNVPRAVRMQRSSSHISAPSQNYPWSIKLDKSAVSLKDSECGSNSTMLTNTNYCTSLVGFEVSHLKCTH